MRRCFSVIVLVIGICSGVFGNMRLSSSSKWFAPLLLFDGKGGRSSGESPAAIEYRVLIGVTEPRVVKDPVAGECVVSSGNICAALFETDENGVKPVKFLGEVILGRYKY